MAPAAANPCSFATNGEDDLSVANRTNAIARPLTKATESNHAAARKISFVSRLIPSVMPWI